MTTQARHRPQTNQNQMKPVHFALLGLIILVILLTGVLVRVVSEVEVRPLPAPRPITVAQEIPAPQISTQLGPLTLESYTIMNPYQGHNCAAIERYISNVGAEENRCYASLALPPLEQIVTTPFGLDEAQTTAVLAKADRVSYMASPARRSGADAAYFRDGSQIFYAFWVAGDCTPRITDGHGGYWQMPVAPSFGSAENVPYGTGYVIRLPENWQAAWQKPVFEAAAWRLCSGGTFWFGGQ